MPQFSPPERGPKKETLIMSKSIYSNVLNPINVPVTVALEETQKANNGGGYS